MLKHLFVPESVSCTFAAFVLQQVTTASTLLDVHQLSFSVLDFY